MDTTLLDNYVTDLQSHKTEWARLPIPEKLHLLDILRKRLADRGQDWVEASVRGKQIDPRSSLVGEEWTGGPWTLARGIKGYSDTLRSLAGGKLRMPARLRTLPNGQLAASVFPGDFFDGLLLNGITAEVWMQPGISEANLVDNMASIYKEKDPKGMVSLVLGAGNIAGIPPRDTLHRLVALGHVVLLKMSPVNDYLGSIFEDIFEPFVKAGYLRFAYGGIEVGHYLVEHPGVEEIHMTGGAHTYEAIVFGSGPKGMENKRLKRPVMSKPFTGELGGVTPVIVVPGKWSRADLRYQAENVITMKLQNAGHNCVSPQVLVLADAWEQKDAFLDEIRTLMRDLPPRIAYYPGAADRQKLALSAHPEAELFPGDVPRTLITDLDPNEEDELCFRRELFTPVFAQTSLPGRDPIEFLHNAVVFCNEKLYGTLGVNIIIDPKTIRRLGQAFEQALLDLRYGSIGINIWTAAAFMLVEACWGGFPGATAVDIQSGTGKVGNSFLFEKPERTVAWGPFRPFPRTWLTGDPSFLPKPPWFVTNRTAHITTRQVTHTTIDPRLRHIPAILLSAFRG